MVGVKSLKSAVFVYYGGAMYRFDGYYVAYEKKMEKKHRKRESTKNTPGGYTKKKKHSRKLGQLQGIEGTTMPLPVYFYRATYRIVM